MLNSHCFWNFGLVSKCQQPTPCGNMRQQLSTPRVVTKRRAERTASQKSSRCLPVATEHAASESPATTGKANWAGRKQDRNNIGMVFPIGEKKTNFLGWYLVIWSKWTIQLQKPSGWLLKSFNQLYTWNGLGKVLVSWEGLHTTNPSEATKKCQVNQARFSQ